MFALRMFLLLTAVTLQAGCSTTPKINLKSGGMAMELSTSASFVFSSVFSPDGKYALSGSLDNNVTVWDLESGSATRVLKTQMGGPGVSALSMSPDGAYLITGTKGGGTVKQWNAKTLQEVRSLPGHSFTEAIEAVAFSPDGRRMISGGSYQIKEWDVRTGKELANITHATFFDRNQPYAIAISPDRRRAFVKGVGFVSLWDIEDGERIWVRGGNTGGGEGGLFNHSAAFSQNGKYILSGEGDILVLRDATSGKAVRTFTDEATTARIDAVAFSPDGRYALSGAADGNIRLWDIQTGEKLRTLTGHSDEVASLVFSSDGRYVLSGGDASTRLWDASSGEELATMIAFGDGEWLVTTPSGYYNSSEKGDQYLNVSVGGKPYTISQLRESFFRPDLVKVALSGRSLKDFRKIADIKPPPAVAIVDTPTSVSTDQVTVSLQLRDQGGGIGDVRLYRNGTAVVLEKTRNLQAVSSTQGGGQVLRYTLSLEPGKNSIRAIAFNADNSMQSTDAVVEVDAGITVRQPALYAVVVGIKDFVNPRLALTYPVADAELFASTLEAKGKGLFSSVRIQRLLKPEETTNAAIIASLRKAQQEVRPEDLFVFYVASHGTVDDGQYILITSNVGSTTSARLRQDALSQNVLKDLISNIPASKKFVLLDTCSAGQLGDALQVAMLTRGMSDDTAMKILSRAVGSTVLSAATSVQEALEGYKGHGLFTYVVVEGLNGKADADKDGYVKTLELADFVDTQVPDLAERVFKRKQFPIVSPSGQGFPLARVQ